GARLLRALQQPRRGRHPGRRDPRRPGAVRLMSDDLRSLYQEVILEHGKHPRNLRQPADANRQALGRNPACGDAMVVYLTIDDQGVVRDAGFKGQGCAISMASASMMTEILRGKSEAE